MPSKPRDFYQFGAYHVFNRGNRRQVIFRDEFDFKYFLRLINANSIKFNVKILAYCLMRNHVHFAVQQHNEDNESISKWMGNTTMSYVHYFNRRYALVGHLFQDSFKSRLIEGDEDLANLIEYIHNNPADFVDPLDYPWSSCRELSVLDQDKPRVVVKLGKTS